MIFERYYREELSKGGFGLGLNIVRNICKEEGIEVSIVSKIGEGSEFLYILKLSHFELSPK
jgi:signal transduction histidine kinase